MPLCRGELHISRCRSLPIVAGGVGESVIKGYYETGLGHLPTPTTLAGFDGLTIGQAFLAFIQSHADLASLQSSIVSYLSQRFWHKGRSAVGQLQ